MENVQTNATINLQLSAGDIREALLDEFGGKAYQTYFEYSVFKAVASFFPEEMQDKLSYKTSKYERNSMHVTYNDIALVYIKVSKQMTKRGNSSSSWYYHKSAEWAYKDFTVELIGDSIQETIIKATKLRQDRLDREAQREANAIKLLKYAMDEFGLSKYQAADICEYVKSHYYSLVDKIAQPEA